jgi:hypothetical protein
MTQGFANKPEFAAALRQRKKSRREAHTVVRELLRRKADVSTKLGACAQSKIRLARDGKSPRSNLR